MLSFLKEHPEVLHVETENVTHVPEALASLAQREIDILAVNGGDGTLQHVLTETLRNGTFEHPPLIVPLRGGRTNMSALAIGSQRSPVAALSSVIEAAQNGSMKERIVEQSVLRVELGPEGLVQYGMSFGVGIIYRAIELTHRTFPEGRAQGVFGSGLVLGTLVTRAAFGSLSGILTPDAIEIQLDGQPLQAKHLLLAVATTLDHLFLKICPFWGQEPAPIRFTAIAASATRPATAALKILYGRPPTHITQDTGYTSRNVHQAELQLDCGLIIDGEMFAPRPGRTVHLQADQLVRFVRT
jgi:hypothetical protein